MPRDRWVVPLVLSTAVTALACGARRVESAAQAPTCPDAPGAIGGAMVVTTSPLSPGHVFRPEDAGARFVFERGYETLLRVDCTGSIKPALATSWTASGAARYVFTLRDSARLWNGEAVTAYNVVTAWRAIASELGDELLTVLADSARVTDAGLLELFVPRGDLALLASPGAGVRRPRAGEAWPEGSGAYRVSSTALRSEVQLAPVASEPSQMLRVVSATPAAARDVIDAGFALLLTGDAGVVSYAASRPGVESRTLDWDRVWVLALPSRLRTGSRGAAAPDGLQMSLVRSSGSANVRTAGDVAWLASARACVARDRPDAAVGMLGTRARIVYAADHPVARAIAERLVALAAGEASRSTRESVLAPVAPELVAVGPQLIAAGLEREAMAAAMRAGTDVGFIISLPVNAMHGCADAESVLSRAAWLSRDGEAIDDAIVVPLVSTRWQAMSVRPPGSAP